MSLWKDISAHEDEVEQNQNNEEDYENLAVALYNRLNRLLSFLDWVTLLRNRHRNVCSKILLMPDTCYRRVHDVVSSRYQRIAMMEVVGFNRPEHAAAET